MTVLPIVGRELVVAARRAATHWLRFWGAASALVLFSILHFGRPAATPASGHDIFNALGVLTLGFSMFAGIFLTADSLSVEKREGTLGLLFLTDLKGYDVVLGKLVANSLHAFFGLLAVFPILALPLLLGGVSGGEFWRLLLVFIITLFSSLSIGLFVSSTCTDVRQALGKALLWVLVTAGILPALWWIAPPTMARTWFDCVLWPSPAFAYLNGFDARYMRKIGAHDFWCSLAVILTSAVASIVAASLILPRSWRRGSDGVPKAKAVRQGVFSRHKTRGGAAMSGENPFYRLVLGECASQRIMTTVLLIFVPLWAAFMLMCLDGKKFHTPTLICFFIAIGLHVVAKILLTSESSRRFHQDRQSGALELLLVTPLPVSAILAGHSQAIVKHSKGWLWVLGLINVAMAGWILGFPNLVDMDWNDQKVFLELFAGGCVVLFLDFKALIHAGMWNGLTARNHPRAVLRTIVQIMALPWLMMFLLVFLEPRFASGPRGPMAVCAIWFLLGIIVDVVSIGFARRRLARRFRDVAANNYT